MTQAHYAGSFYPADPQELTQLIDRLKNDAKLPAVPVTPLRAVIIPHAGYIYSGLTAAHSALALEGKSFDPVIIMAPDHRVGLHQAAITDSSTFSLPSGTIAINPLARQLCEDFPDLFAPNTVSDHQEHAVEVTLPFLQNCLPPFSMVPMVIGQQDPRAIAAALTPHINPHTLLVASSDLSHFLPYDEAVSKDKETLAAILDLNQMALRENDNKACGLIPIRVILTMAQQQDWQPVLLHYSNSGDTAGDRQRVVGYAAIAFYEKAGENISLDEQQQLLSLARNTITHALGAAKEKIVPHFTNPLLHQPHGVFVTLHAHGQLRGCIGSIMPEESIVDGVRHNAINAAFHDPRFPAVSVAELADIAIEISILSPPQPLAFTTHAELLTILTSDLGVILRLGNRQATFLPQVWEQLPEPEDFLTQLSLKAGLNQDGWRDPNITISTYKVIAFAEER